MALSELIVSIIGDMSKLNDTFSKAGDMSRAMPKKLQPLELLLLKLELQCRQESQPHWLVLAWLLLELQRGDEL